MAEPINVNEPFVGTDLPSELTESGFDHVKKPDVKKPAAKKPAKKEEPKKAAAK